MSANGVREAVDAGDVDALRNLLRDDPSLVTALVDAPEIEPTSPLTYVGMARFYGYATHDRTGDLARVLLEAGADADDETKNGSPLIWRQAPEMPTSCVPCSTPVPTSTSRTARPTPRCDWPPHTAGQ